MIDKYEYGSKQLTLSSDLAGEFPLYLYLSNDKKFVLYCSDIQELLDDPRVKTQLELSDEAVSFLLQSGVAPPPKTIYKNIYLLGIGGRVALSSGAENIELDFCHRFPFRKESKPNIDKGPVNYSEVLEILAEATISRIDRSKHSFLFHSSGKDSNMIALALAEAGWQGKVTLITHKSKGSADESEISQEIAKKLGFSHRILNEVDKLEDSHKEEITEYFKQSPFPCVDNVTLAYPLYVHQMSELRGANIIDGGGNDSYMKTLLDSRDSKTFPLSRIASRFHFFRSFVRSESLLTPLLRTPAEWCGMSGLSFFDSQKIYPPSITVYGHWRNESASRRNWDIVDFKTDFLTSIIASELHIRKARIFADSIGSNFILPFANANVADYFNCLPESLLFDRANSKSKILFRDILKDRIGLDSDSIGKKGFTYDSRSVILENIEWVYSQIMCCKLWDQKGVELFMKRMLKNMKNGNGWSSVAAGRLLYKILVFSIWFNKSRYVNNRGDFLTRFNGASSPK